MKEQRIGFITNEPKKGETLIVQCIRRSNFGSSQVIIMTSEIEDIKLLNVEEKIFRVETENVIFYVQKTT